MDVPNAVCGQKQGKGIYSEGGYKQMFCVSLVKHISKDRRGLTCSSNRFLKFVFEMIINSPFKDFRGIVPSSVKKIHNILKIIKFHFEIKCA